MITQAEYAEYLTLKQQVKWLMEQLKLSKHRQFAASSEKREAESDQLGLFDEAENTADTAVTEPALEEITYKRRKRSGKRADDLSCLPVEIVEYILPEEERACPECSGVLHVIGRNSRQELIITPAQVKVVKHRCCCFALS